MAETWSLRRRFLLFDLDGTLIDSAPAIADAWSQWSHEVGVSGPDLERALGGTSRDTIKALVPDLFQDIPSWAPFAEDLFWPDVAGTYRIDPDVGGCVIQRGTSPSDAEVTTVRLRDGMPSAGGRREAQSGVR
jgi:hypothetical protein